MKDNGLVVTELSDEDREVMKRENTAGLRLSECTV